MAIRNAELYSESVICQNVDDAPMKVRILFFGATADIVGTSELQFDLSSSESASTVFERILSKYPSLTNHHLRYSVNQTYATGEETICEGDELALFTAVSGG